MLSSSVYRVLWESPATLGVVIEHDEFMRASGRLDEPYGSCDLFSGCGGGCRAEAIAEHFRVTGDIRF